jgi:hypothetical protein
MRLPFLLFVFFATSALAQSVRVSAPVKDSESVVTLKLSYDATDADYRPATCAWYSFRQGSLALIHDGCGDFLREFAEGQHILVLIANGKSSKLEGNDQRSDVAILTVEPRVKTEHTRFRPEDLAALEAAAKKK